MEQMPIVEILEQIGHQLKKLSVCVWDTTLLLDRVFRMCPNLQNFYVDQCPYEILGVGVSVPTMSGLTELALARTSHIDEEWGVFDYGHLVQVLRAMPNLSVFRMNSMHLAEQEAKEICEALEQHLILQKLETLGFYYEWPISHDDPDMQDCIRWSCSVLRSMIRHCPKLASLRTDDWQLL